MPPPKLPAKAEQEPQTVTATVVTGSIEKSLEILLDTLQVNETIKAQVADGDLSALQPRDTLKICAWYAQTCGLHESEVCAMKLKDGRVIPYVKATGVMRFARGKVKSVSREMPKFENRMVIVFCTVTMIEGNTFQDFACRELTDSKSVMACSTAATVRALRLACGIPLPSENEL